MGEFPIVSEIPDHHKKISEVNAKEGYYFYKVNETHFGGSNLVVATARFGNYLRLALMRYRLIALFDWIPCPLKTRLYIYI